MEMLLVKYQIGERKSDILDKAIRDGAKALGYEWCASGFSLTEEYRELCFEREG